MNLHVAATILRSPASTHAGASIIRTFPLAVLLAAGLALLPATVLAKASPQCTFPAPAATAVTTSSSASSTSARWAAGVILECDETNNRDFQVLEG